MFNIYVFLLFYLIKQTILLSYEIHAASDYLLIYNDYT